MAMATYIRAVDVQGPTYDPLGVYLHNIRWETNGRGGFIVQHFERHEVYVGLAPHGDVRVEEDYWEAWRVDQQGGIYPIKGAWNDSFTTSHTVPGAFAARTANSRGRWRIKGTVYWASQDRFDEANWTKSALNMGGAGILYTRPTRPNFMLGIVYLRRNEAGEWDGTAVPVIAHRHRA